MSAMSTGPESAERRFATSGEFSERNVGPGCFEPAALAIHVLNSDGLIVEVNSAFEIMFGASRRLYLGKHNAILCPDPIAVGLRLLEVIRSDVNLRGVWRGTMRNERFNGTNFEARAHVYPMRVGERGYLVFFQEQACDASRFRTPNALRMRGRELAAAH